MDMGFWILIGILIASTIVFIIIRRRRKRFSLPPPTHKKREVNLDELIPIDSPELAEAAAKRVFPDQDQEAVLRMFKQFKFRFSPSGGGFRPDPEPSDIESLVHRVFPPARVEFVVNHLDNYGKKKHETDLGSVRLDIVKLSDGDADKIPALVKKAKTDFRDIILMAENPNALELYLLKSKSSSDSSKQESRETADADLRQFGMWLLRQME